LKVEFYRHNVSETDMTNVAKAMRSLWLTTGDTVAEFERKFAEYIGCEYAVGVMSCTAALHLSLLAYGIGEGDEVITTPMTFVATANSIIQAGAKPVFVDVEPETGNIDINKITPAINDHTKAIMPVHLYGQLVDMNGIAYIAQENNLTVIEDAAHAPEAKREDIRVGQISDTSCYSQVARVARSALTIHILITYFANSAITARAKARKLATTKSIRIGIWKCLDGKPICLTSKPQCF
jgi:UDP-4-amino-4-deoxy-L-arabinose-oxoglutarate aminotransferase